MAKKKIIIIGRGGGQNQDTPADITELQQQIQQLTAERNALSLQLDAVTTELEQANANVTGLTAEKVALQEAVDELNNQITDLDTQIETLNKRILELEETIKNLGGDVPSGEIIPGGPHNPENDAFEEDFLWIENVDDTDGTITLNLAQTPFIYYSYDDDTEFQKMVNTNKLSIPAHSKIYLRWKGHITGAQINNNYNGIISNTYSNCNHNIGGELKNGGLTGTAYPQGAYSMLFDNDKKLIDASQLKLTATKLASSCYSGMFYGCTSLTQAPALPATKLASSCYESMFRDCTSLTIAPELPGTTLVDYCYTKMFQGCTSLTIAPELPATTLVGRCYESMFQDCTSLTIAPELPAAAFADYGQSYYHMFYGCTSLNYVKTNLIKWNSTNAYSWLYNVAPTGIVEVPSDSNITENSTSGIPSGWTKQINTDVKNTINIHNISGLENTISIPNKFSAFKYKTNNDTEYTENPKSTALTITLKADEILTIEGIYNVYNTSNSSGRWTGITSTENINVSGEVNYTMPYMLNYLFNGCGKLIDASQLKLPVTTLANNCYWGMFYGCTSLTQAPALPATKLASSCYEEMFYICSSLTTAPTLPATTLAGNCYKKMFSYCSNLTTAPTLPDTTLAGNCYQSMFQGCNKLNSITFLSTEPFIYNDSGAKSTWVSGVSSTGTFRTPIENKEWLDTYPRGTSTVPSGWTIEYIE